VMRITLSACSSSSSFSSDERVRGRGKFRWFL
jgi:hypothetical protein